MNQAADISRRVLIPRELPAHLSPPDPAARVSVFEGKSMGTYWCVRCILPPAILHVAAHTAILATLGQVICQMSHWDQTSELCRFNHAAARTWHSVSAEFFAVLEAAVSVAAASEGAFDPAIGRTVDHFGFGPGEPSSAILPPPRVGGQTLVLNPNTRQVYQPGGIQLDLSSIAKGFAVDWVVKTLGNLGVTHQLVEIGGELCGQGFKPDGSPWWCQLESPEEPGSAGIPETVIALCGLSVATSGDSLRRRQMDGREISHLIDPRSGYPCPFSLASVSVIAPSCMLADAWATALYVMGPEAGHRQAEAHNLAVRFLVRTPGELDELTTRAFRAMME